MEKAEFFDNLYSLDNNSQSDEEYVSEARDFLHHSERNPASRLPPPISSSPPSPRRRNRVSNVSRKSPAIHRSTSAPVSSINKETPPLVTRKTSLLRHDISFSDIPDHSFPTGDTPLRDQVGQVANNRRTVSTPSIGSVVMKNSTGITSMLKDNKKRKRKEASLVTLPEEEQVLRSQVFYFIPPNDIAPLRQRRITSAKKYGALWATEWDSSITHVVVDKGYTFDKVTAFAKSSLKMEQFPPNVILVNEEYPIDCIRLKYLLDPHQPQYSVQGLEPETMASNQPLATSQIAGTSPSLKEPGTKKKESLGHSPKQRQRSSSPESQSIPTSPDGVKEITEPAECLTSHVDRNYELFVVDDLDEMIKIARGLEHLPIDDDSEEDRPGSSEGLEDSDQSGSEGERFRAMQKRKNKAKKTAKGSFNQANFTCMKGGTGIAIESNPNRRTIEILQEMADFYGRIYDIWRTRAYRMAIGTLKQQATKITNYEEAFSLPTIGDRLANKIVEIHLTDRLRRLEYAKLDPNEQVLSLFLKIYNVGAVQAGRWMNAGYRTLEDLKAKASLTAAQKIGIDHYEDFNTRISRDEVTALGEIVKAAAAIIDPNVEIIISGSYRRGASSSGDIDCLLTKTGTTSSRDLKPFLNELVLSLTNKKFLVAALAASQSQDGSKWNGACVLPGTSKPIWRRIDLLVVPASELGAALIYFTGDDIFNRSIRLLAGKKKMRLNQRGLYKDVMRGPGREKLNEGTLLEGEDEGKIFEILGVPWRKPENRICH